MRTSLASLLIAIASIARCESEPLPIEPKLYLPGSFLISATSSATLFTPRFAGTVSALGCVVRMGGSAAHKTNSANATMRFIDPPGWSPALGNLSRSPLRAYVCRPLPRSSEVWFLTDYAMDREILYEPCDPDPWIGRLHRHASAHDPARDARSADRKVWRRRVQGAVFARLHHRHRADRLGFCALSGNRLDRRVVSAHLDAAR